MKNFKTTTEIVNHHIDHINTRTVHTEEGFATALLVHVQEHFNPLEGEAEMFREVVSMESFKLIHHFYESGLAPDSPSWEWQESYYWCVRRGNGKLYPLPLLYASEEERQQAKDARNSESWNMFYAGLITSNTLEKWLVDCPTPEEVEALRASLKDWVTQGESPWDHLDQRGGLVPRWAA